MSSASVVLTSAPSPAAYDFSGQQSRAFGVNAMVATGSRFSMIGGDADGSGVITIFDRAVWRVQNSYSGYLNGDMNLDGIVTIFDRALWRVNNSLLSQVP